MSYKWIGAMIIIAGCFGCGAAITANHWKEKRYLQQLLQTIHIFQNELTYRLTSVPDLCRQAGKTTQGALGTVFKDLSRELEWQIAPDIPSCMAAALQKNPYTPGKVRRIMVRLGRSLGHYDLQGQLRDLDLVRAECEEELLGYGKDWDQRVKSYRILCLCAGAALVILFA